MAGTNLYRTPTARTNSKKFTYSCWFKRSNIGTGQYFVINYESGNDRGYVAFETTDKMFIYDKAGGTDRFQAESNFVLRDTNAWYHLVYSVDSTASSNRTKIYINGIDKYSDFTVSTARALDSTVGFQQGTTSNGFRIGSQETGSTTFDGLMSHVNFVDGLQLDASAFGETDSTTGEWKIKTSPTVSEYGNNGFFILKDGNSVTDQSGKGNNFAIGGSVGSLTNTKDCPSNVFATLNPLDNKFSTDAVFSNGNNYVAAGGAGNGRFYSTLGMVSGKYYCEIKNVSGSGGTPLFAVAGTSNYALSSAGSPLSSQLYDYALYNGNVYNNDATVGGSWGTPSDGNIIGIAINLDNEQGGLNKLYFSINGVWQNGADPSNFTSATGVVGITKPENMAPGNPGYGVGAYFFACGDDNSFAERRFATNFGNGYFQTTAVTTNSGNGYAGAEGASKFNYAVPTGFTALSTKGLNL